MRILSLSLAIIAIALASCQSAQHVSNQTVAIAPPPMPAPKLDRNAVELFGAVALPGAYHPKRGLKSILQAAKPLPNANLGSIWLFTPNQQGSYKASRIDANELNGLRHLTSFLKPGDQLYVPDQQFVASDQAIRKILNQLEKRLAMNKVQ